MFTRPCRKRKGSFYDARGISWFSLSFGGKCGFLPNSDGKLRERLVLPQRSPVSIRVVRGSAGFLSSHGRGIGPQLALKGKSRGLSLVVAGNFGFP